MRLIQAVLFAQVIASGAIAAAAGEPAPLYPDKSYTATYQIVYHSGASRDFAIVSNYGNGHFLVQSENGEFCENYEPASTKDLKVNSTLPPFVTGVNHEPQYLGGMPTVASATNELLFKRMVSELRLPVTEIGAKVIDEQKCNGWRRTGAYMDSNHLMDVQEMWWFNADNGCLVLAERVSKPSGLIGIIQSSSRTQVRQKSFSDKPIPIQDWMYVRGAEDYIKTKWYPDRRKELLPAVTAFKIDAAGHVSNAHIVQSSGDSQQDDLALRAIEKVARLGELKSWAQGFDVKEFVFDKSFYAGKSRGIRSVEFSAAGE